MKKNFGLLKDFLAIWKEYCLNCSLAGIRYIADNRFHPIERAFWLICVTLSAIGSYILIMTYRESLESTAISMVDEDKDLWERIQFPSVGVCELGSSREENPRLVDKIKSLMGNSSYPYSFDVEEFLLRVIFQNMYSPGSLHPYCAECDNCFPCPSEGYLEIADVARANCPELLKSCFWQGEEFDCCRYFLPIKTTMGLCFLMNSIQTTKKGSENWLPTMYGVEDILVDIPTLKIVTLKPSATFILNEEDIPHIILPHLQVLQESVGSTEYIKLNVQQIVNDPTVRDVSLNFRRCIFPDEQEENSPYKYYSFSVCATECIRAAQLKYCNCTHHNLIYNCKREVFQGQGAANFAFLVDFYKFRFHSFEIISTPLDLYFISSWPKERYLSCDYQGLLCLDKNELVFPQTTILQPWSNDGVVCDCLPSCTENEMYVVEQTASFEDNDDRTITIATHPKLRRYRRQVVRNNLDLVVTIGGVLGLIGGASVLSVVELFYFFIVRLISRIYEKRHEKYNGLTRPSRKLQNNQRNRRWGTYEHLTKYKINTKTKKRTTYQF